MSEMSQFNRNKKTFVRLDSLISYNTILFRVKMDQTFVAALLMLLLSMLLLLLKVVSYLPSFLLVCGLVSLCFEDFYILYVATSEMPCKM